MQDSEWHEYDRTTKRCRAFFRVRHEHFAFRDHKDILHIQMIDRLNGFVVLKSRHTRSFFSKRLLPDACQFFAMRKDDAVPPPTQTPGWCAELASNLTAKGE
jgi:hypothetical protein